MPVSRTAYGAAHFGKSLLWHCSALFFAFYLTEVAGFSPKAMGALLAGSLILNALFDLGIGARLGRWVRTLESAAKAQALGALVACTTFLAFASLFLWPQDIRAVIAVVSLIAFRIGYSCLDVPQNTILAFISRDDVGRTQAASVRYMAAGASLLIVTLSLAPWLTSVAPVKRAEAFFLFALCLTPVTLATAGFLWWRLRHHSTEAPVPTAVPNTADGQSLHRADLYLALGSILIYSGLVPLFTKLEAYFVAYAPRDQGLEYFMVAAALGQVIGQLAWMQVARQVQLLTLYRIAALCLMMSTLAFMVIAPTGGLGALVVASLFGVSSSGLLTAIWSFLARSAAASPASATLKFGLLTFCSKMAQAGSAVALGFVLSQIDYRRAEDFKTLIQTMASGPLLTAALCLALTVLYSKLRRKALAT